MHFLYRSTVIDNFLNGGVLQYRFFDFLHFFRGDIVGLEGKVKGVFQGVVSDGRYKVLSQFLNEGLCSLLLGDKLNFFDIVGKGERFLELLYIGLFGGILEENGHNEVFLVTIGEVFGINQQKPQ